MSKKRRKTFFIRIKKNEWNEKKKQRDECGKNLFLMKREIYIKRRMFLSSSTKYDFPWVLIWFVKRRKTENQMN